MSTANADGAGYLGLPPEIRLQILTEVLIPGMVCPCRGLTAHERCAQDWQIMTAALLQAWGNFIRNPSSSRLRWISRTFSGRNVVYFATIECLYSVNFVPRCLSTCRTVYEEGHELFYSKNIFFMSYGPLSTSKDYYDGLQTKHKRLIRHMVIELHWCDLTNEAFGYIEDQLRAKDVARGRLPPDDSLEDWLGPVVYQLMSIWRSKLAWLQDWTWLQDLEIHSCLRARKGQDDLLPPIESFKVPGEHLPSFLKGIGPVEPHCPVVDCYKECNSVFAEQMRIQEEFMWTIFTWMIGASGWKCTKAMIRKKVYDDASAARSHGIL